LKKILAAALCIAVPGLLFLNAWQGYRYHALEDQVAALEQEQKRLLEANRDAIAQIAYEQSPERIAAKASRGLGLSPLPQSAITRLQVGGAVSGGEPQ
jgi:cell division protein FtsL